MKRAIQKIKEHHKKRLTHIMIFPDKMQLFFNDETSVIIEVNTNLIEFNVMENMMIRFDDQNTFHIIN
jgi:hypothetical protein